MIDKFVLIVTDGDDSINKIALEVKNALESCDVKICPASEFDGVDLLRCTMFFIGCSTPTPASFSYLKEMLAHINLAGRKCGIFSVNKESIKYLEGIIKDSEAAFSEPLLISDVDASQINAWAKI